MKLLCAEHAPGGARGHVVLGDNALWRGDEDFYIPSFATRLSCVPQLAYRVCKLGKGIAPRFARRYTGEGGVALRFYADNLLEETRAAGLPPDPALGFDRAAVVSPLRALQDNPRYALEVNGATVFSGALLDLPFSLDDQVAALSRYYLLKVGDLLFTGNTFRYSPIQHGDHLRLFLDDACLLDFFTR
ncbi:MAG: fumarylacetoacetate hydrolase family protein [Odoribacteraceae bacterium]|jgi:hypothetical protein|nr:fumarylacetoacetate hydrolase family protein [Odoribacteraceae bacterium]